MANHRRWRDTGHLERAVETAGGRAKFEAGVAHLQAEAQGRRLAEMRKRRGLTQRQVSEPFGKLIPTGRPV